MQAILFSAYTANTCEFTLDGFTQSLRQYSEVARDIPAAIDAKIITVHAVIIMILRMQRAFISN